MVSVCYKWCTVLCKHDHGIVEVPVIILNGTTMIVSALPILVQDDIIQGWIIIIVIIIIIIIIQMSIIVLALQSYSMQKIPKVKCVIVPP